MSSAKTAEEAAVSLSRTNKVPKRQAEACSRLLLTRPSLCGVWCMVWYGMVPVPMVVVRYTPYTVVRNCTEYGDWYSTRMIRPFFMYVCTSAIWCMVKSRKVIPVYDVMSTLCSISHQIGSVFYFTTHIQMLCRPTSFVMNRMHLACWEI